MTDKTPQNKADIPVNTPTVPAGTTDATRNSGPKSRALPQAGALKERFKAGSIPLQTDFADLIDLANIGRQAVGGAEGQTGPANGFTLSSMGRLELKPNTDKGINVDKDGVAVKVNTSNGLKMTSSGIAINDGLGIEFSSTGQLNLKVKKDGGFSGGPGGASVIPGKGITISSSGVGVKAGNGIAVTSSGVNVKLAKGAQNNGGGGQGTDGFTSIGSAGGLALSSNGLSVSAGNGIQIDSQGVSIKLAANSGLSANQTNGLKLVPEQQFQKGMIMMFSGTSIPLGWALCDGNNGTPNLINRFIMGGRSTDVGGRSDNTFSGGNNTKTISFNTKQSSVYISGSTDGHSLTAEENGPHSHYAGIAVEHSSKCLSNYRKLSRSVDWLNAGGSGTNSGKYEPRVYPDGSGKAHRHNINFTSGAHSHNGALTVPYYILAFIIKL